MTQEEFNQAQKDGKVETVQAQQDPQTPSGQQDYGNEPYTAALEVIRRPKIALTATPTNTPRNFPEQIEFISDGTKRIAAFIDGEWVEFGTSGGGMTRVAGAAVSSANAFSLSGLLGDTDKIYKLLIRAIFNTTEPSFFLRFNNDDTSNYHYSILRHCVISNADTDSLATSSALVHNKETLTPLYDGSFKHAFADLTIYAVSGNIRFVQGKVNTYLDEDNWAVQEIDGVWLDDANQITQIDIAAGQNFLAGSEYILYKLN